MKTAHFFAAALLGLGTSFSAHAQTPVLGTPGAVGTPGSPATPAAGTGTIVPGQPGTIVPGTGAGTVIGTGTLPAGTTTPIGTPGGTMTPNGTLNRNVDGGTLRVDQPAGTPAVPGAQPGRRLNNRTRTTTGGTNVRP